MKYLSIILLLSGCNDRLKVGQCFEAKVPGYIARIDTVQANQYSVTLTIPFGINKYEPLKGMYDKETILTLFPYEVKCP